MKKLILLLSIIMIAMISHGQKKVTEVTSDGYINSPSYVYVFGTTADTIAEASSKSYVLRIKGDGTQNFNIQLYNDWVSGTAGGTLILSHSINGITYTSEAGDTITISSVTGDALDTEVITKSNFLYPYMKLTYSQTGVAVTIPKVFIYTKRN